ncbi:MULTISPECIES: GntR family transcriptional regulator [Pseudofrankia]|uniref:GntR family transcriptional regulator n=1 Tax=Pseudofrankia TaxID=2994363 RepID=UPI000234B7A0|nr:MULTISPECIES: GntR family transcriptional regulator [Pseudofrankia]
MVSHPIKLEKASSQVVDYLLEEIFEGRLRSGQRIDIINVSKILEISRSPVREAVVMLERDGIVSSRPHRGVFVEPFDADSILDDFEVMGLLSGVAVARLATRPDPEVIAELRRLVRELEAAGSPDRMRELVQEILRAEHRAGGSRRLLAQLRAFAGYLSWVFRVHSGQPPGTSALAHGRVVEAIAAGEPEQASHHRVEDFRAAGKAVVQDLARRGVLAEGSPRDGAGVSPAGAGSPPRV